MQTVLVVDTPSSGQEDPGNPGNPANVGVPGPGGPYGPWAVVAGGPEGIGAAFARQLAGNEEIAAAHNRPERAAVGATHRAMRRLMGGAG